jgi:hypothetical protein
VIFRTTALVRHTTRRRPYGRLFAFALTFIVTLPRLLTFALTLAAALQVAALARLLSSLFVPALTRRAVSLFHFHGHSLTHIFTATLRTKSTRSLSSPPPPTSLSASVSAVGLSGGADPRTHVARLAGHIRRRQTANEMHTFGSKEAAPFLHMHAEELRRELRGTDFPVQKLVAINGKPRATDGSGRQRKMGTDQVPTSICDWRARRDSNSRPPGS